MNEINVDFNAYIDQILVHLSQVRSSEGSAFRITRSQNLQSVPEEILIDRNSCSAMYFH